MMLRALLLLGAAVLSAQGELRINPQKLAKVSRSLGMAQPASFVELGERGPAEDLQGFGATPADLETGDFEIKCSTSCGFVKRGAVSAALAVGKGPTAYAAAQELSAAQRKLKAAQQAVAASPENKALQSQIVVLTTEVNRKVAALQAAAGGTAPSPDIEESSSALAMAQRNLDQLTTKRQEHGESPELDTEINEAKMKVASLRSSVQDAGKEAEQAEEDTSTLNARLEQLRAALKAKPGSAEIKAEMAEVQATMKGKEKEGTSFKPKNVCNKVCTKMAPPKAGGARRLLGMSPENCILMCINTMRELVHHVAEKF